MCGFGLAFKETYSRNFLCRSMLLCLIIGFQKLTSTRIQLKSLINFASRKRNAELISGFRIVRYNAPGQKFIQLYWYLYLASPEKLKEVFSSRVDLSQ